MKKIFLSLFFVYQCLGAPPNNWPERSLQLGTGAALAVGAATLRTSLLLCNSYDNASSREFCTMAGMSSTVVCSISAFILTLALVDLGKLPRVVPIRNPYYNRPSRS